MHTVKSVFQKISGWMLVIVMVFAVLGCTVDLKELPLPDTEMEQTGGTGQGTKPSPENPGKPSEKPDIDTDSQSGSGSGTVPSPEHDTGDGSSPAPNTGKSDDGVETSPDTEEGLKPSPSVPGTQNADKEDPERNPYDFALSEKAVFLEEQTQYKVSVPEGYDGYAVLMNFVPDGEKDGRTDPFVLDIGTRKRKSLADDEDKAMQKMTYPYYKLNEKGENVLLWDGMMKGTGGVCDAYEFARDMDNGIIYMFDRAMSSERKKEMANLLLGMYSENSDFLPPDAISRAEKLAGTGPARPWVENGISYKFILIYEFGNAWNGTLGLYSVAPQIRGLYPIVNMNADCFRATVNDAYNFATTVTHEYSHLLEATLRMRNTGDPGFNCHLLAEGYADWASITANRHKFTEEGSYLSFYLANAHLWHPKQDWNNSFGVPLRMADYGLGCMMWSRLHDRKGLAAVQTVLNGNDEGLETFEKASEVEFDTFMKDMIYEWLASVGVKDLTAEDISYLTDYIPDRIWHGVFDTATPAHGVVRREMTKTGVSVIKISPDADMLWYQGKGDCIVFALPKTKGVQ